MKNAIHSPENYDPYEEPFTAWMRNMVLQTAPMSLFGPLVAILVPHLKQPISKVTHMVADLGEAEEMIAQKEIWSAPQRKNLKDPLKVTGTQMWVDLIGEGADREKLGGKSNRMCVCKTSC